MNSGKCYSRTIVGRKTSRKTSRKGSRKSARKTTTIIYQYKDMKSKKVVTDQKTLAQLNEVKIPATYTNVIICPDPKNSLQATAYDGTGRKQYFYSKKHLEESRKDKYCNLIFLGMNINKIMKDIDALLRQSKIDLDVLNAAALKIMLMCNFRVGSLQNRKKYDTYGLSTLSPDHIKFTGGKAIIKFNGKKQQLNECVISDSHTIAMLKKLYNHNKKSNRKNKYLFSWEGQRVSPESLNEFLGQYHDDITTKTWRTWFANIRYITLMRANKSSSDNKTERKKQSNDAVKKVATELHHTPAICKKNYLMTELTDLYVEHPDKWKAGKKKTPDSFFMDFLKTHFCISKDWIRQRSRSRGRKRSRSKSRIGGALGAGPSFRADLISERRRKEYIAKGRVITGITTKGASKASVKNRPKATKRQPIKKTEESSDSSSSSTGEESSSYESSSGSE